MPMCDSDAAGSSPRRRSSALARIARSCAAGESPPAIGNSRAAQALTTGIDAE